MTCSEVEQYLDQAAASGSTAVPASVREHMSQCGACRELWDFLTQKDTPESMPSAMQEKIADSVTQALEPVKPLTGAWKLALAFFLIFAVIAFAFVAFSGIAGATGMGIVPFMVVLALLGLAALLLSITLSREMVPGSPRLFSPTWLFFGLLAALFAAVAALFPWEPDPDFSQHAWECFRHGLLVSIPVAIVAALLLRRGFVLSLEVASAGAGMLGGLAGMKVLHFGCHMYNAPHIAVGHFTVAVVGMAVGYVLGRFLHLSGRKSSSEA